MVLTRREANLENSKQVRAGQSENFVPVFRFFLLHFGEFICNFINYLLHDTSLTKSHDWQQELATRTRKYI